MKSILSLTFVVILFLGNSFAADFQIRSSINKDSDASIAYNSVDDEYLVVWTESSATISQIMGQRMKADGTGNIGSAFTIFSIGAYPSVAYNSQTNEYMVTESLFGNIIGRRVSNVGTLIGSPITYISKSIAIWSKIIYNSLGSNYLLVGAELTDLGNDQSNIKIYTMKIAGNGQETGMEHLVRDQGHGNYSDGARFSIAYAPIISTKTPDGRYLLAIDYGGKFNLTMLDDNGVIVSRVNDSQHPGGTVDDYVPFQYTKVGSPSYNVDVAFGNFNGEDVFMVVWGDNEKDLEGLYDRRGIWAGIVPALPIEFESNEGVSSTVIRVLSFGLEHSILKTDAKTWKPVVAYNKVAYKFMIAWREIPTTLPGNDTKVNHIRAAAVYNSYSTPTNVVLSAISGSENPMNPAIAASTKNPNALVVWEDARNIATKDIDLYGSLFTTTPAKALILTSPNGGEIWQEGTEKQITWESAGIGITDVRIEYSTDHGATFNLIAFVTSLDGGNSYNWIVPNTPSTKCLVQITAGGLSDQSDNVFKIKETPQMNIVAPNGGEVWASGTKQHIKWESFGVGDFDVSIKYSTDNGVSYQPVAFFTNVDGLNTFDWEVPNTPSTQCLVHISLFIQGVEYFDVSDAVFTIVDNTPKITVVSPNGGETWSIGEQQEIKWISKAFSGNVRIDLLYHGTNDSGYFNIALNELNDDSFNWNLDISQFPIQSTQQGFNCLIRVSDATANPPGVGPNDGKIFDWSDSYFIVQDNTPKITVISPNGREVLQVGTQHEIKWDSQNFTDPINIYLVIENAIAGRIIIENIPNTGSYFWTVSYERSKPVQALILVKEAKQMTTIYDYSDSLFTIVDTTSKITVISPNGGEVWERGSQHEIKWESINYTDPVRIDALIESCGPPPTNGDPQICVVSWQSIEVSNPNTGSYMWTVRDVGYSERFIIQVADETFTEYSDGKVFDQSDDWFSSVGKTNTSIGNNVYLDLGDGTNINFDQIDSVGATSQFIADIGSSTPSGKQIFPINNPKHYYIETTAKFSNNIQLCFAYSDSGLTVENESNFQLNVYDTTLSQWVDITTTQDLENNTICGEVNHLSEFAIMIPRTELLIVTNTNDLGEGSFRNAIDRANSNFDSALILFNIPKTDPNYDANKGVWYIRPVTYYQSIQDSNTMIDGTSQRIFIGEDTNPEGPEIVFSGSNMSTNNGCLSILANNIEIYEITINNFPSVAISFNRSTNSIVSGCYIGTDYSGMTSASNYHGITMGPDVNGSLVGPSIFLGKPNVISGNDQNGIFIVENSKNNAIIGNYIGVNKNATDTITNKLRGIDLSRGADNNTIMQNIVGGNYQGIYISESNNNLIRANKIGTNENWEYDLFNSGGILVFNNSSENIISENIVGYNRGWGIKINGANSAENMISRNTISKNWGLGIDNAEGGNTELAPPIITSISNNQITGSAGPNQIIEIFADSVNEGQIFIDSTIADVNGNFSISISISNFTNLPYITATATDNLGNTSEFSYPLIVTEITEEKNNLPISYALYQNYPNPFNPSTTIQYSIPSNVKSEKKNVKLTIYDILGNEVLILVNKYQSAGDYKLMFNAKELSSGVYFYQLKSGSFSMTKKMLYLE